MAMVLTPFGELHFQGSPNNVFKFVKPQYISTIVSGKLHFSVQPDLTLALKNGGYSQAPDLLGTCFSGEDDACQNVTMWDTFADNGKGMCFWLSIYCGKVWGSASGDLDLEIKRASERANIPITGQGLDMEGHSIFEIDELYGVIYSNEAVKEASSLPAKTGSTGDLLHVLAKEEKHKGEKEVRLFTLGQNPIDIDFTAAQNGFLRLKAAVFGPAFDSAQIAGIKSDLIAKFGQKILFYKVGLIPV